MKLYITKWALTAGIIEVDASRLQNIIGLSGEQYWRGSYKDGIISQAFYPEEDITDSLEQAKIIADTMRLKKIMQLKKQIEKLENKKF